MDGGPADGWQPAGLDMFLLREDTDWVIVSERVFRHLRAKGHDDVFFEEVGPGLETG